MENVFYISDPIDMKYFYNSKFDRIYFGNEFCDNLLPSKDQLKNILNFVKLQNLKFSFVTPICRENTFKKLLPLIEMLPEKTEIIFNDWGLYNILQNKDFELIHGRILNKVKKDIRIKLDSNWDDYYKSSNIQKAYQGFLLEKKVYRIELDNVIQGYNFNLDKRISSSLYYPFVQCSITRKCFFANKKNNKVKVIGKCHLECNNKQYKLQIEDNFFYVSGNVQYYINNNKPKNFKDWNIDRFVYMPCFPNKNRYSDKYFYLDWNKPYKHLNNFEWIDSKTDSNIIKLLKKTNLSKNFLVLDIGCGNGRNYNLFKGFNIKYFGIDISRDAINICKREIKSGIFYNKDILKFDNNNLKFDFILDYGCFHSIPPFLRNKYIKKLELLLKENCFAIIGAWVSNNSNLPFYYCYNQLPEWGFDKESFSKILNNSFEIIDIITKETNLEKQFSYYLIKKKKMQNIKSYLSFKK